MIFKGYQGLYVNYTDDGKIVFEQYSTEFGKPVSILVTLDQFKKIEKWVKQAEPNIQAAWNDGVDDA